MVSWCLPKLPMLRTYYTNFCSRIYIFYFRIIIFSSMNCSCPTQKFFSRHFSFVDSCNFSTFRTILSMSMIICFLIKCAMSRTYDFYFWITLNIIYFEIIIFIFMNSFKPFYSIFVCYFWHSYSNIYLFKNFIASSFPYFL